MKKLLIALIFAFVGCLPRENSSTLSDMSWTPGTELEIFRPKKPDCNEYYLGFFGCKEIRKTEQLTLNLSAVSVVERFRIARRVHVNYKFPCTASKVLRSYLKTQDGEIELTSTTQPEIRPVQFVTYQAVSNLTFSFPEHTSQIDVKCNLTLTSWFALPVVEGLRRTWDGIKENLATFRGLSEMMSSSPNQVRSVIAVINVKNGLIRERDKLESDLLATADTVEQAIIKASILKLDQKIGDKNCGDGISDCGLTLVQRNLESCNSNVCDSFIGEARSAIDSVLSQAKSDRDNLAIFIEAELDRIRKLNQAIDHNLEKIGIEIKGDRNEV